jgi:predicted PurR-regulated permease PerM
MPSILSFVQPEFAITNSIIMIILLVWLDQLVWNIIEPKFMWDKLNLSPVVIILALAFWWMVWWIVWMFLSAPIMVIINIILSRIPETRPIAVLLSEKWKLPVVTSK